MIISNYISMSAKPGGRGRGKGRGRGRGRGEGTRGRTGEEDEGSPEYLPPRHQRELLGEGSNHNPGPSRGLRSRIPVPTQGQTQEFLNRPDVRAAAGLGGQNSGGGGVAQQGGEGAAEVRPGTEGGLARALEQLNSNLSTPLSRGEACSMRQKALSGLIEKEASLRLFNAATSERDKARLNCVSREGSGD